jgi:hypothetical protein
MTSTLSESPTPACFPTDTPDDFDIPALTGAGSSRNRRCRTRSFETSCTPSYYNKEGGGGEGIRSHLGAPYGPGFYAFGELLAQWRATGNMEGMELRS